MEALDALGNPVRRRILELLHEEPRTVGALAAEFPVSRPAISRHLRVLESAGLVDYQQAGRTNVYTLRIDGFEAARDYLSRFWDDALLRYRLVTENLADATTPDGRDDG